MDARATDQTRREMKRRPVDSRPIRAYRPSCIPLGGMMSRGLIRCSRQSCASIVGAFRSGAQLLLLRSTTGKDARSEADDHAILGHRRATVDMVHEIANAARFGNYLRHAGGRARPGFLFAAVARSPGRSTLPQVMPFSRNRTTSICVLATWAWSPSQLTPATVRLQICCTA